MDFFGNLVINAICLTILIVIFVANIKNLRGKFFAPLLFQWLIFAGISLFVVDTFGRMDGLTNLSVPLMNQIGNFMLFALNLAPSLLWLLYVVYQIYGEIKIIKKLAAPAIAYFAINLIVVIINLFYGFYYSIDANNVYSRGPAYAVSVVWTLLPMIVSFVITSINHKRIDYRKFSAFVFFPTAPIIGAVLSFFTYGYSIILPSMLIAYILVFLSIQSDTMRLDYLTGVFNRRHLENFLRRKIGENNPSFAGIMLDIDSYKKINDEYGHLVGDQALVDFARVLKKSVGVNDVVARYGGDEFMIIIAANDAKRLQSVVDEIKENIEKFNAKKKYPFSLNASLGQALYVPSEKKTMEQFINYVDDLMYKNKKNNCLTNSK